MKSEPTQIDLPFFPRSVWIVVGILFLVLATVFVGGRTYKNFAVPARDFDWQKRGMSDFYTLYYYSKAFSDGVNPYSTDVMQDPDYIVPRNAAPFSPFAFLLDVPLTWMPLELACGIYFVFSWCLIGVLAWCCIWMSRIKFDWAWWLWIFGFLVFSRPGHITLFTGYFTVQVVLGAVVALHYSKSKPWIAAIGFLFAAVKPTYAIPLTLLMLARRDLKAVAIGVGLTLVFAIACFGWLSLHANVGSVIHGIQAGQDAFHDDPTEEPINTWTRIDIAGMAAKVSRRVPGNVEYLAVMMLLLIVPSFAIWKASKREDEIGLGASHEATGMSALIVLLALLVTIYHHSYDCLILAVSIVGLALNSNKLYPAIHQRTALLLAGLLAIPMLNYVSTKAIRDKLGFEQLDFAWQAITMVNGFSLTAAMLVCIYLVLTRDDLKTQTD